MCYCSQELCGIAVTIKHMYCIISVSSHIGHSKEPCTEVWKISSSVKACSLAIAPSTLWVSPLTCPSHLHCVLYCSLQVKLMKYICKQLQCKQKVPETERPEALDSYPHLGDWLRTINLRPELIEVGRVVLFEYQSLSLFVSPFALAWVTDCVSLCTQSPFRMHMTNTIKLSLLCRFSWYWSCKQWQQNWT